MPYLNGGRLCYTKAIVDLELQPCSGFDGPIVEGADSVKSRSPIVVPDILRLITNIFY